MNESEYPYYISHVVRCSESLVRRTDGRKVEKVFLQVISSRKSSRKSVCWGENGKNTFFNCKDDGDFKRVVKIILSSYVKFQFEILTIDRAYEEDLFVIMVNNFLKGEKNLQEKIDGYKLNKELE